MAEATITVPTDNAARIKELLKTDPGFAAWKQQNAPHDSGQDYDLYGAYKAGLKPSANQHFPDTFKLPGHPRFSIESQYWKPGMPAGRWEGEKYIPMDAKTAAEWVKKHGQNMAPQKGSTSENDLQKDHDGITGFLSGLMDAFKTGGQNTLYAIQDDLANLREGKAPHNIMHDLPGLLSMMGSPSVNPTIPALQYTKYLAGPEGEGQFIMKAADKVYPGGTAAKMATRSGMYGDIPQELLSWLEKAQAYNAPPVPGK